MLSVDVHRGALLSKAVVTRLVTRRAAGTGRAIERCPRFPARDCRKWLNNYMMASGPIYESGTFWTAAGAVVTLAAIFAGIAQWLMGSPRRLLVYNLDSDTALLTPDARQRAAQTDLKVVLAGQVINDPHIVSFRIESRSRRDIRPEDFINSSPVYFEMNTCILKMLHSETGGDSMPEVPVSIDGDRVAIGPSLIKNKQAIRLDLLTDGSVRATCPHPALADVLVRERPTIETQPSWLEPMGKIIFVPFFLGMLVLILGYFLGLREVQDIGALVAMLPSAGLVLSAVVYALVLGHRGGWMRGPVPNAAEQSSKREVP